MSQKIFICYSIKNSLLKDYMQKLKDILFRIDGRGYRAYKQLKGAYNFPEYTLYIDHVQGDPFASPSRLRIRVSQEIAEFGPELYSNKPRKTALEDYIIRIFSMHIKKDIAKIFGTGKSGIIEIDCGKQEIIERTACNINAEFVEIRFYAGLPARGRRILGQQCIKMLFDQIPKLVEESLFHKNLDKAEIKKFIEACEDQDCLRSQLNKNKIISFIKNGSILPRRSGVSDKPLPEANTILFKSPPELEVSLKAPNIGIVKGMGIPLGVTLLIGGGFHGKTTILSAIQKGVYNHIPGDGREYVVTDVSAVKIKAEEGRSIQKVDISSFVSNLPLGKNTKEFSTANASGSTSQAANIIEALEINTKLLLLDEDTSATNFLIRDSIMQQVVSKDKEPITPFIDQVNSIYSKYNTSTIMVMGGSGDYFEVADTILLINSYLPYLATDKAKEVIKNRKDIRKKENPASFGSITERIPLPNSINPYKGRKRKVKSRGIHNISFGAENIDLSSIEQIVESSQVNSISNIILYGLTKNYFDGKSTLCNIIGKIFDDIGKYGLDIISDFYIKYPASFSMPRKFEVASAINRLRSLKVIQK